MITNTLINNKIDFRPRHEDEPEWFYNLRVKSWDRYQETPLPDKVVHLWRYTKPEWFQSNGLDLAMNRFPIVSAVKDNEIAPLNKEYGAFGCNHGDRVIYTQLSDELKESGVIFTDLMTAVLNHPELVKKYLGKLIGSDFGKFEAQNLALWNTGMFLYIPPNIHIDKPIFMHRHPNSNYNMSRLLVIADKNSQATIIDDYAGHNAKDDFIANSVIEIFAGQDSHVRYVSPQNLSDSVRSYITQRTQAEKNAQVYTMFVSLGADVSKQNLGTVISGKGANSQMLGILFGNEKQHFDHHTLHHHVAGDSYSNIDFKVVLKDKAVSAYTGLIKIDENTLNCEAYQENRNLLLNKGTKAESIPELEILNDQVSCSHGATVGPIDPEMVFYLQARGFSREDAVRTIVRGFIEPLLQIIPEDLRNMMQNMVEFKLTHKSGN